MLQLNKKIYVREDFRRDGLAANFRATSKTVLAAGKALPNSVINIGYPGICYEELQRCKEILTTTNESQAEYAIVGHSREDHVNLIKNLVNKTPNTSGNIWAPVSDKFINATINKPAKDISNHIKNMVSLWKQNSNKPLDIALADSFQEQHYNRVKDWTYQFIDAGARRIILCDTRGDATPCQVSQLLEYVNLGNKIEFHPHDDNAQGISKAHAAYNTGSEFIGTAMYKSGERKTMLDVRELSDIIHYDKNRIILFDKIYSQEVGNPEIVLEEAYSDRVITTGTQWRLRDRDPTLIPQFGVTSDTAIAEIVFGKKINPDQLSKLKDRLLYNGNTNSIQAQDKNRKVS